VAVGTDGRGLRAVARAYGLLDNDAVAARLRSRAIEHDITLVRDTARGAAPNVGGAVVGLASGRAITTTVVVDASGHPGALVARGRAAVPGWQVAAGIVARFDEPPIEPGTCMLMDWRTSSAEPAGAAPTFLYGMDLGDGTYLVEETVLAARRPPSVGALAARLERRLERAGTPPREVVAREAVHIPMGVPVPPRQRVVAYGAAAGLIHPATGYSVAASLARAPAVALAIRQAVDRRVTPAEVSAAAWRAVWPAARRRVRALEQYGLGAELAMDARQLGDFFDAFFALPVRDWAAYLDGGRSLLATGRVMGAVFAGSPPAVRRRLVTGDVRALRDLLG
jgi:lycopene beta-cyclase